MWQIGFANPNVSLDEAARIYCEEHKPESAKPKQVSEGANCWTCDRLGKVRPDAAARGSRTGVTVRT